jgi:HK97 family phage major capsid protein
MDLSQITRSIEEVATISKAAGAKVDSQIAEILKHTTSSDARILDLEQKILTRGAGPGPGAGAPLNLGALLAGDAKLADFRAGNAQRIQIPVAQSLRTICRSILTNQGASGVSPATDFPSIPELVPGGVRGFAQRRLAVLEALPILPVSTAIAEVPYLVTDTDAAAAQWPEGSSKAETVLTFDGKQLRSATIATVVNVSKQLLSDSPLLGEFLRVVLLYGVSKKLENLICTGTGDSTDQIAGFTQVGNTYTSAASHPADRIGEAIAYMAGLGYTADLIILSPTAYFDLVAQKDSQNRYQGLGWNAPMPGQIWGCRVAPSVALSNSQCVVIDTQQTTILDRQEAQLSFGYTGNQFSENVVTVLMELRAQLAVYDARAVQVLTMPVDSPG